MNRTLKEIGKRRQSERRERLFSVLLFILIVVLAVTGLVLVGKYVGLVFHEGQAGYIYAMNIYNKDQTTYWAGIYGVAVRVSGYTNDISYSVAGGSMQEANLLFDCLEPKIDHEVYASLVPGDMIDWDTIRPATVAEIDDYLAIDSELSSSATNTFIRSIEYALGSQSFTVPGTFTFKEGESVPSTYDIGALIDGNNNLLFATHIMNFTNGFNGRIYNYQMILPVRNNTLPTYYFFTDPNDVCPEGEGAGANFGRVYGTVTNTAGMPIEGVIIVIAGYSTATNVDGYYNFSTREGNHYIFAVKTGYQVYVNNVTVVAGNSTEHNIVMQLEAVPNPFTGPGQTNNPSVSDNVDVGPGKDDNKDVAPLVPIVEQPKIIEGKDYIISPRDINRKLLVGNFLQEIISFYSFKKTTANLVFGLEGNISNLTTLDKSTLSLPPNNNDELALTIFGQGNPGMYEGNFTIRGDINETIHVTIDLLPRDRMNVEALLIRLDPVRRTVFPGSVFRFETNLQNLLTDQEYPVALAYTIQDQSGNRTVWSDKSNVYVKTSFSILRSTKIPANLPPGEYVLRVTANYLGLSGGASTTFSVVLPFYQYLLFGVLPVWQAALMLAGLLFIIGIIIYIKRKIDAKKRYHLSVEYGELPHPGPKSIYVGKIAETDHKTYFDLNNFKTHTIVAGATGGGKSFAAQGLVEEALLKNVCVFVFDPTAQWSGMLRKCKDKGILSLYPNYGMKQKEARAFNGNIRQITNPLEKINIRKYLKPGEIQIFATNKMDPKDIDIFVANTIKEVFHANFDESQDLRLLLVYDEVHRLLPKFGGSGEGFLQIERGVREFRKWGLGILLISQVLADFVGQIKANINTELQMRTRDEGDLERIRVKYGEGLLQSLVKASVGTGMVENPAYNRGKPYFVSFRPILHSVQRLSDEELEKYNKYNEIIEDLTYQLEQLEEEKIDVFDLKLELKLSLDKVKSGNFNMVDIYLEGITPRIDAQWKKLGKTPKKFQVELVNVAELKEDLKKAQEERAKFEAEQKKQEVQQQAAVKKKQLLYDLVTDLKHALTLSDGTMVMSLQELADVLPNLRPEIYSAHAKPEKNSFADWLGTNFDVELGQKARDVKSKSKLIALLEEVRKAKQEFKETQTFVQPPLQPTTDKAEEKKKEEAQAFQDLAKPADATTPLSQTMQASALSAETDVQQSAAQPSALQQSAAQQSTPEPQQSVAQQPMLQPPQAQPVVQEPSSTPAAPASGTATAGEPSSSATPGLGTLSVSDATVASGATSAATSPGAPPTTPVPAITTTSAEMGAPQQESLMQSPGKPPLQPSPHQDTPAPRADAASSQVKAPSMSTAPVQEAEAQQPAPVALKVTAQNVQVVTETPSVQPPSRSVPQSSSLFVVPTEAAPHMPIPPVQEPQQRTYTLNSKIIPENQYFRLEMGGVFRTIHELKKSLVTMSPDVFTHHVTQDRNDFSNWLEHVFDEHELSARIAGAKTKEDMVSVLDHYGY